VEIFNNPKISR